MSQTHELSIRFPAGLEPTDELRSIACEAAEQALRDAAGLQAKVEELRQLGIDITLAELLRKRRGPIGGAGSPRSNERAYTGRRVRLSAVAKEEILAALKAGTAATDLARQHGCALGTIMNLKRQAGLTRPRKKEAR